jgi:hypothetical protein
MLLRITTHTGCSWSFPHSVNIGEIGAWRAAKILWAKTRKDLVKKPKLVVLFLGTEGIRNEYEDVILPLEVQWNVDGATRI